MAVKRSDPVLLMEIAPSSHASDGSLLIKLPDLGVDDTHTRQVMLELQNPSATR